MHLSIKELETAMAHADRTHTEGIVNNYAWIQETKKALKENKDLTRSEKAKLRKHIKNLEKMMDALDEAYVESYGNIMNFLPPEYKIVYSLYQT